MYETDFLLTWNFKHIANAHIMKQLRDTVEKEGFVFPTVTTPEELIGE
ncbi:MAG: type II toxin-antitoxin system VapC family toxin [Desulfobacterales bacterium]|nr:type II toxin-antitoxin system VapC family toxin [Desulfobacterales bacterium]